MTQSLPGRSKRNCLDLERKKVVELHSPMEARYQISCGFFGTCASPAATAATTEQGQRKRKADRVEKSPAVSEGNPERSPEMSREENPERTRKARRTHGKNVQKDGTEGIETNATMTRIVRGIGEVKGSGNGVGLIRGSAICMTARGTMTGVAAWIMTGIADSQRPLAPAVFQRRK